MSVFKLPGLLLKEIETMLATFWWSHKRGEKGIHWQNWKKLGMVKSKGGQGFRDLDCFNTTLIAKQVFKGKYFQNGDVLQAKVGSSPSFIWRSLWSRLKLIKDSMVWRVGNGRNIRVWKDKWLP
ncbi:hypothetical protein CIPAW_14G018800 [Carya illinoinensis]|uniref:Uncharacterized protein n=1 Tax=Carya illinoinensis TaxID=32201 RepID=A0A8T1NA12_CARIL|nr:hypothetical protein CIPAW_14G018800 [Carya illinoinensis]